MSDHGTGAASSAPPPASMRRCDSGGPTLSSLQVELVELIASRLTDCDLISLSATAKPFVPLLSLLTTKAISLLEQLLAESESTLSALVGQLPRCRARRDVEEVFTQSLNAGKTVCTSHDAFVAMSRTAVARGIEGACGTAANAARIARATLSTCDDVAAMLSAIKSWLRELLVLVASSPARRTEFVRARHAWAAVLARSRTQVARLPA